jgi:hypothetical protein
MMSLAIEKGNISRAGPLPEQAAKESGGAFNEQAPA